MKTVAGKPLALIVIAASLAMFMSSLDGTIVNIALPAISKDFSLSTSSVAWVSTIYLLVSAGSLLIVGKISDMLGYKKMFLTGFVIFTFGSFACGFFPMMSGSFASLLIARVIQALGGVIMTVVAPAILTRHLPGPARAKGTSIVMLFASLGMALGPTLGGFLTQNLSWFWIFYINIPVGIAAVIFGLFVLPKDEVSKVSMKGFDGLGAALIFIGLASLLFTISEGSDLGWGSVPVIIAIVLAVVGLGGFFIREHRASSPILDFSLFKNPAFLVINLIFVLLFFSFSGVNYLMPFYLELIKGMTSFNAGLVLTIMSIGMMVSGVAAGLIYAKLTGRIKYMVMIGVLFAAAGYFLLSKLHPFTGPGVIIAGLACVGLGLGLTTTPLSTLILGGVPAEKQGMVSGITGLERTTPMTIGIAFFNLLLIIGVKHIAKHEGITTMPPHEIAAGILTTGFDLCFLISFIVAFVLFILCFFINEKKLQS